MRTIPFPEVNLKIAENQPEFETIEANRYVGESGVVVLTFCWEVSVWEALVILWTGKIWHRVMTPGSLQPQFISVENPFKKK